MAKYGKLDLYKEHRSEYVTPKEPVFVVVAPANYLSITGKGGPSGELFQSSIGALYSLAYTIKMTKKFAGHDYKVCHLEGLWWSENDVDWATLRPEDWHWRLIIRVPDFITQKDLDAAVKEVMAKGKAPLATHVKLEKLTEGRCVQVLHVGPYAAEKGTVDRMKKVAEDRGLHLRGPHHEIYLSDPRRVPEARLRTILRYPVQ